MTVLAIMFAGRVAPVARLAGKRVGDSNPNRISGGSSKTCQHCRWIGLLTAFSCRLDVERSISTRSLLSRRAKWSTIWQVNSLENVHGQSRVDSPLGRVYVNNPCYFYVTNFDRWNIDGAPRKLRRMFDEASSARTSKQPSRQVIWNRWNL